MQVIFLQVHMAGFPILKSIVNHFESWKAKYGVYVVAGNHDVEENLLGAFQYHRLLRHSEHLKWISSLKTVDLKCFMMMR